MASNAGDPNAFSGASQPRPRARAAMASHHSGERGAVGAVKEPGEQASARPAARQCVAEESQHIAGIAERVRDQAAGYGRADRMQIELERGCHAEIAAAATQRPEQVRDCLLARHAALRRPAVTSSTDRRLSRASPYLPINQPIPPPRVRPATPVVDTTPPVTASPCSWVSRLTSAQVAPPCTRAVRCAGST